MEEKKSKGKKVVIIILVILVLGLAGYISYDKYFYKYFKKAEVKEVKDNNKKELKNLDIESSEVKDLYEKLVDYSDGVMYPLGSVYNSSKTTYNNLNKKALLTKAYDDNGEISKLKDKVTCDEVNENGTWENTIYGKDGEKCDDSSISLERFNISKTDIQKKLINIIGIDQEKKIEYISFEPGPSFTCTYYNDEYYCYDTQGGDNNPGNSVTQITKAEKDEKGNVYIYDNYILFYHNLDTEKFDVYNTYDKDTKLNTMEIGDNPESIKDYITKYGDEDINTFKHTFKKDSAGNYYWYSTEIVEK